MPKARALKNYKIVNEVNIFWRFVAVGNGSKIPLFDFFSAFAEGMSLRYRVIVVGVGDRNKLCRNADDCGTEEIYITN